MTDNSDVIQARLEELRLRFIRRMFKDREVLALAWEKRDSVSMRDCSHKLAGIAASFGFAEVGDAAAELQDKLDARSDDLSIRVSAVALIKLIDSHKPTSAG